MIIAIDCEWDGFNALQNRAGDLISMALVAEDGSEFYEVLHFDEVTPWVSNNVIPILNKDSITFFEFQTKLKNFLSKFKNFTIVADWPEDIAKFCEVLICGPGLRLDTPNFTMKVVRVDSTSQEPHNALADARGLMEELLTGKYV